MGAVLTPALIGVDKAGHLPNASTFCGRCESVCPVRIPLPKMMRHWREREFERHLTPGAQRSGLALWAWFARRPGALPAGDGAAMRRARPARPRREALRSLPLAGGWTEGRDLPTPEPGGTFMARYAKVQREARR